MKIAFVWYWDKAYQIKDNWRDGLRAALELIAEKHQVNWYLDLNVPEDDYDWIIMWGDAQSDFLDRPYKAKRGIFLSAMPQDYSKLKGLDIVFCESQPILEAVRSQGIRATIAFGTDTDFFSPDNTPKKIDFFYPATFSPWKRQSEIAYLGSKLTCIGTVQPDGQEEFEECKKQGVNILTGYFPAEQIRDFYRKTKNMIIPAVHGSERTVLEAMSMNILPKVTHPVENPKTFSYILEYNQSGEKSPREFILKNYSHHNYANKILKVIEE